MKFKENLNSIGGFIVVVVLFILASYIVQHNLDLFRSYILNSFFGMIVYALIVIVSTVLAPINEIVLIPLATALWGWPTAALLTLIGWTVGASIVFILTRKYGAPLIKRWVPLNNIQKYERLMPKEHVFVSIVFLRLAIPIDIVSYAIGLFTNIKFWPFFFSTLIGFIPLAFFLAYLGTLPAYIQIMGFITFSLVVILGFLSIKHRQNKKLKTA